MEHCTQFPEEYSKVASVQKRVDEVKNIMSENIEKVWWGFVCGCFFVFCFVCVCVRVCVQSGGRRFCSHKN